MSAEFERQKNIRALAWTGGFAIILLIMLLFISWTIPTKEEPPVVEFVEINLGSGDFGSGMDQPFLPGDPAPAEQMAYNPPQPMQSSDESVRDASSENEQSNDAPAVVKPVVSNKDAKKINTESQTVKTKSTNTQPVVSKPKPKAVLGKTVGGSGNGGNGADTYKPGSGEGVAGGSGDQGRPGGSPNGTNYSGTPKNFGVKVFSMPNQSFEDDFNQNAKIAMDVEVNASGKVTRATYQPKGSTGTATDNMKAIARKRAFELKFPTSEGGQKGTVIFNFKVKG